MNLFELFVKIGVDDQASGKLGELSGKLGNGLKTAAKIGTAAVGAAAAGITALTKSAIDNYAEYEQLIGGVETLYGAKYKTIEEYIEGTGAAAETAAQTFAEYQNRQQAVLENAANAYKTAGMSANEYMNTVNGFAASLTNSLGEYEWQAANYADMIVSDMADNANKMGTSMDMIQNAYAGFAKQNYTMLDNLKLGYGGTKTEMERLLRDAERMAGYIEGSLDIESFADVADAIHIVQEEMGITGTTAKEASTTISGSVSSMKSAWQNLVTGISDENANLEQLVGNFVDSAITAAGNIAPRIEQVLSGIGTLGEKIAPVIAEGISAAVEKAPELLAAGANMLVSLGNALMEQSDLLIQNAFDLILVLADGLIQGVGGLADSALELVEKLAMWVEEYSDVLGEKAVTLILTLVNSIVKNLPKLAVASLRIMASIGTALIDNLPELIKQIPTIIAEIVNGFADAMPDIIAVGEDIVRGIWEGISDLGSWLGDKAGGFFDGIVDGAKDLLGIHSPSRVFAGIGENMALGLGAGWDAEYQNIKNGITSGLDFGTGSVDFKSSAMGAASRTTASAASFGGEIVVEAPVYVGGSVVARNQYRFNMAEAQRRGGSLVNT